MRILIIHRELPFPADNGGRLRAALVTRYLASEHQVSLICFSTGSKDLRFEERDLFEDFRNVSLPGPKSWMRRALSGVPSEVLDLASPEMERAISSMVQQSDPDVILTSEPAFSPYLNAYRDRVLVLDYLMVATLSIERLGALAQGWKRWLWHLRWIRFKAFHRRIVPLYDLCLVNSQEDHDDLMLNSPGWSRLRFLPNGLMLAEYPLGLSEPDQSVLVYPGSVTYAPNRDAVEFMVSRILPQIRAAVPNVRLVVTGAVPKDGSAPQGPGIIYTGRVDDVRPVIAGAWVCVVPLRSGAGGTRFKVLESMALGTPLVSTNIGAEGVDCIDGSNILIANTAESFAANTIRLLKSPEDRLAFSLAGRRLIEERYDWKILGTQISKMLQELVESKNSGPT